MKPLPKYDRLHLHRQVLTILISTHVLSKALAGHLIRNKVVLHEVIVNAGAKPLQDGPLLSSPTIVDDMASLFRVRTDASIALAREKLTSVIDRR